MVYFLRHHVTLIDLIDAARAYEAFDIINLWDADDLFANLLFKPLLFINFSFARSNWMYLMFCLILHGLTYHVSF